MCLLLKQRTLGLLAVIAVLTFTPLSQTPKLGTLKPDALKDVSPEKRARLAERIELYVRGEDAIDLDQIYALLPRSCTRGLDRGAWRSQVQVKRDMRLRGFVVDEVYAGDYTLVDDAGGEKWIAKGCGTYQHGKSTVRYQSAINLVLIGDEVHLR